MVFLALSIAVLLVFISSLVPEIWLAVLGSLEIARAHFAHELDVGRIFALYK